MEASEWDSHASEYQYPIHLQMIIIIIHVPKDDDCGLFVSTLSYCCHFHNHFLCEKEKKSYFNFIRRRSYHLSSHKKFQFSFSALCATLCGKVFRRVFLRHSILRWLRRTNTNKKNVENKENLSLVERQKRLGWKSKFILYARQKMGKRSSDDICEDVANIGHATNR